MQKVITINLNGHAYQLDESGYEALRAYLDRAEQELEDNPDRAEIMADLEQAIADKCQKYLGPQKTVVGASEMGRIVTEMGPVHGAAAGGDEAGDSPAAGQKGADARSPEPRRLYRIMDGAMVAGVCNGLAAYFGVDVTIARVVFAVAVVVTQGIGILAYLVMMFVVPEAKTPAQEAAGGAAPFNAKAVVDRVKQQYAEGSKQWRRHWRRQQREWRRRRWAPGAPIAYGPPPIIALLLPVFGLVHVALFLVALAMLISLVNTGSILSWELPSNVPVWAGALILLIGYQIVVSPIRAAHHWPYPHGVEPGWYTFWNGVTWLLGLAFVIWIAANNRPELQEFLQRLPDLFRDFIDAIRNVVNEQR